MSYIEVVELTKIIKGHTILDSVNLTLEKGNIYGLVGTNGSGKTMLLRAICGLIRPSSGSVRIDSKLLRKEIEFPPSCGVLIENPGFWDDLTGFECLKVVADIKKLVTPNEIREWMEYFGLNPDDKKCFGKYSLGMKQKIALIQAVMEKPEMILLDEPMNGLDSRNVKKLRQLLLKEKERGAMILLCSHNSEDIKLLADQTFIMEEGRLREGEEYEED
ncbi:MAG TPA: ABC transporter ATP-binding protein [Candidatus Merdenecus merdavium]|nr:ABC transporter ATP-binding protein [Candidatus Merdenecus merdavium]